MAPKATGVIFIRHGDFTATHVTLLNRYTHQALQNEDLDKDELFNRLKQLNIIDDGLNTVKLNAYLSSKARNKRGDEMIIEYVLMAMKMMTNTA